MIFIDNEGINDPRTNLAIEEYAIRNFPHGSDHLLFYINKPSIIIGRHQNTLEEINQQYCEENNIDVVRRISGGGAVYHDFGCLNFSFMTDFDRSKLNNFKQFTAPIVKILNEAMNVPAEMVGRNDIEVKGRKISGNAQFSSVKRMFSHGTLMLDTDLNEVTRALDVKMTKIKSKGHKSARARVANISEFLDEVPSTAEFREIVLQGIMQENPEFETYKLKENDWQEIEKLKAEKYDNWDWNYGRSPKFDIKRAKKFDSGLFDLRIKVKKGGIIENVKIYGDFFGRDPVEDIENALEGVRYEKEAIQTALKDFDLYTYFGAIDRDDFINLIYGPDEL